MKLDDNLITVNSLSGGKTSSFIAVNYPANINIFALVRTNDKNCIFPDSGIRKIVSDKIGHEFIGTLEQDEIIYTMLDLEQNLGIPINWISPLTFEDVIKNHGGYLPNKISRFCTVDMKIKPIAQWLYDRNLTPCEMRIGFRANEQRRANTMIERVNEDGWEYMKFKIGEKNGRNRWKVLPYRKTTFPLIKDGIFKDNIEKFWQGKKVRFAYANNCVGCFHRNPVFLKHISGKSEKQFDWFIDQEEKNKGTFKSNMNYKKIKSMLPQLQLFDSDFTECDSGFCGI